MGYQLGVDLGTTYTAAAVHRDAAVEIVTLGNRAATVPSVIFLKEDESILVGDAASRRGVTEPGRVAREFKRRIGDPTPIILGGTPYSAEALTAKLLQWTIRQVTELQGGPPDAVAVTHPANWGPYKLDLLHQAVRLADLDGVTILPEPEAAAIYYASNERVEPGSVIAVDDLGGGTFDAAVLRKTGDGWETLGSPEGIERLGGIDFDEAVFSHVRGALPDDFAALDAADPVVLTAVARMREDCVEAKEGLSADTDVSIPVLLPNVQTDVRLTRDEFESMVRPTLQETVGALRRALRSAEVEPGEVSAVLLVGGSSRIPLVAQLVGAEIGRPVAVDAHPKHAIALGAALAAAARPQAGALAPGPVQHAPEAGAVAVDAGTEVEQPALGAEAIGPPVLASADGTPTAGEPVADTDPGSPTELLDTPTTEMPTGEVESEHTGPAGGTRRRIPGAALAAAAAIVLVAAVVGVVLFGGRGQDVAGEEDPTDQTGNGEEPDPTDDPTGAPTDGPTGAPTSDDGTQTAATEPPRRRPYAEFTDIRVDGARYVFAYEAAGFTPLVADAGAYHVHFFWDTLPVINAGVNGPDPGRWLLWDTPFEVSEPFFDVANRPTGARQICVVIADNGHAVADVTGDGTPDTDTGDCIDIPGG